jgi:hypothetical protein
MRDHPFRPWRYAVPIMNAATGERRMICVTLFDDERQDALDKITPIGGPEGLVVIGYVLRHASQITPPGFARSSIKLHL